MNGVYREAAEAVRRSACTVAVTGAGVSAESGIPTFRGAGGIWEKYPPERFATIEAYRRDPDAVWQFWCELAETIRSCRPNPAHITLARLEQSGHLHAVITQNVDNLHQAAGSRNVIEYHGNAAQLVCLACAARKPMDPGTAGSRAPHCPICGGLMKPDVVMFGEDVSLASVQNSEAYARRCNVMIVVGTSAQVYPAAWLPRLAKSYGAYIIEMNIEPTEFTNSVTDTFLEGAVGNTLPRLADLIYGTFPLSSIHDLL